MNARTAAVIGAAIVLGSSMVTGCAAPDKSEAQMENMEKATAEAKAEFIKQDGGLKRWFDTSYGYAIFPSVGKGGVVVGGAYGQGLVYEQGKVIGTSALSQATIGAQLGGQAYREVVFFEDKSALDRFTQGDFQFSAQASAVAVTAGASADADFRDGMAIFTMQKGGLMFEASVGGQRFSYRRDN